MESNNFEVKVLADSVREYRNGEVHIPYGEYTLKFFNMNDRRGVVKIYVDGENVSGGGYILDTHRVVIIERYSDSPRKFKFVELDSYEAMREGKDQSNKNKDMGLIECRFYLEKKHEPPVYVTYPPYIHPMVPSPWDYPYKPYWCSTSGQNKNTTRSYSKEEKTSGGIMSFEGSAGATVHGGHSNQTFHTRHIDLEDSYTTILIQLKGFVTCPNCHGNH